MNEVDRWHKENLSKGQVDEVKEFLKEETKTVPYVYTYDGKECTTTSQIVNPIPIIHNEGKIYLQFRGWSINLYDDGTWCWEDTTGG